MATNTWIATGAAGQDNSFSTGANWSTGSAPGAGDTVIFDGTGTSAMTGALDQHTIAFALIIIYQSAVNLIGNIVGATRTYFQHAAPLVLIGQRTGFGQPTGSQLLMLDSGGTTCTYAIYDSSNQAAITTTLPPIQLKGTVLTVDMSGGAAGIAVGNGEVSTLVSLTLSLGNSGSNQTVSPPQCYIAPGVTVTAMAVNAGTVLDQRTHACTAATINGGTYTYQGTGATTTLTINSGVQSNGYVYYSGTGTITTLNNSGTFDHSQDGRQVTITNSNAYSGATFNLNNGVAGSTVFTNSTALVSCSVQDLTIFTNVSENFG